MLSPEHQIAQMSKIKNGGLDQHGTGPFEQHQFGTAGVEGVNYLCHSKMPVDDDDDGGGGGLRPLLRPMQCLFACGCC